MDLWLLLVASVATPSLLAEAQDITKVQVTQPNGVVRYSEPISSPDRCEEPFIVPQFLYERDGRHLFTFTEGAVLFKGLWRFYYGALDERIGLAELDDLDTLLKTVH